jgi:hypothetical protein
MPWAGLSVLKNRRLAEDQGNLAEAVARRVPAAIPNHPGRFAHGLANE